MTGFDLNAEAGLSAGGMAAEVVRSAEIIDLPGREAARVRLLANSIVDVLEGLAFLDAFRVVDCGQSQRIEVDAFAAVMLPAASRDLLFELRTNAGPRILLVTDDQGMMVDFVRQYVRARIDNDPALQECL